MIFTHGADFSWYNEYAPGTFVTAWGSFPGVPGPVSAPGQPLPTTLGGVTVSFQGTLAPISYVSKTQINFVVPTGLTVGNTYTVSINDGSSTQTAPMKIVDCWLRLFGDASKNTFVGYYETVDANGQHVITPLYGAGGAPNAPSASTAGVYLVLYGTGHGQGRTSGLLLQAASTGLIAPVFVGDSGFTGVTQLNFLLPNTYKAADLLTLRFLLDTRPKPQPPGEPAEGN